MRARQSEKRKALSFREIDPLHPPSDSARFGRLAAIVSESATWFFAAPDFDANGQPMEIESRSLDDLSEAIEVAHDLLRQAGGSAPEVSSGEHVQSDPRGFRLVDLFCDRHARKEKAFSWTLKSGRSINQRQLLCAMALHQCEQAARAALGGDTQVLCNLMQDLLELICEIRRALDREAGSTIAARRARQRHAKHDRIRIRACELYDEGEWRSAKNAARRLWERVLSFSQEVGAPLSTYGGEDTLYRWLRAHRNTVRAQQT